MLDELLEVLQYLLNLSHVLFDVQSNAFLLASIHNPVYKNNSFLYDYTILLRLIIMMILSNVIH